MTTPSSGSALHGGFTCRADALDRYLSNIVHDEVVLRVPREGAEEIAARMAECI